AADPELPDVTLDVLGAESEGMVGYLLAQALGDHLDPASVVTLLTQVEVDAHDPAFDAPVKAIGPRYDPSVRASLEAKGWTVLDDGDGLRRVVPSPEPQRIVELAAIRLLSDEGCTVVCAGGGGIPVTEVDGRSVGVEAVVDKDLASARLAIDLGAAELVLVTGVDAVYEGWGTDQARALHRPTVEQLRALDLPAGSMGPKVDAACRFVEATGGVARIGALDELDRLLAGDAGTVVGSEV
ncbi:carbamate kinase, partial [cyanobacterium TDX16]